MKDDRLYLIHIYECIPRLKAREVRLVVGEGEADVAQ